MGEVSDKDLWFLPGPVENGPDDPLPGVQVEGAEAAILEDWAQAEAQHAAHLARVAGRLGALDDRMRRGPKGWRHRLALMEAAELGWWVGDRIGPDRLALWMSMRLSGVRDDTGALNRVGWAARRLSGGPGPETSPETSPEALADFLDRRDPVSVADDADRFADRADGWRALMTSATALHPITRAGMGFHLWALAGLGRHGDRLEAAVTAARIAMGEGGGAVFAPLALNGGGALRASGPPVDRLERWLDGMTDATVSAMRHLDDVEAWSTHAQTAMGALSGRTPPALCAVLMEWPMVSAPMAEALTGASRAAVQRNLDWMEGQGLVREVTGQGRFRMWRIAT